MCYVPDDARSTAPACNCVVVIAEWCVWCLMLDGACSATPASPSLPAKGLRPCKPQERENCVICFDSLASDTVILRCKHIFHRPCILRWACEQQDMNEAMRALNKAHCPVCRSDIEL